MVLLYYCAAEHMITSYFADLRIFEVLTAINQQYEVIVAINQKYKTTVATNQQSKTIVTKFNCCSLKEPVISKCFVV